MKAVMVKGAVIAAVAAVVLAPEARAVAGQAKGSCRSGAFSGSFTLNYESDGTHDRPLSVRGGAGPYIGDSGTVKIRLFHLDATGAEHVAYVKARTNVPAGQSTYGIPEGIKLPRDHTRFVTVSFSGGGFSCSAKAEIK